MASTNTTHRRAVDSKQFKLYSHEEAVKCGFISKLEPERDGICLSTPNYPGVALYTTNPLSPSKNKAVGALVQIIPADDAIIYSEITAMHGKEVTINMICTTKDTSTPVRFLLGNFFRDETLFTITDGKNNLVDLIVAGQSLTKLPGTTQGKEVLLADTGLKTSLVGDMGKRPTSGTSYKITISRMTEDPRAFLSTFDNNDSIPLMTLKTPPPPYRQYPPATLLRPTESGSGSTRSSVCIPPFNGGFGGIGEMTAVCSGLMTDGPGGADLMTDGPEEEVADLMSNVLMTDGPGEEVADCAQPSLQRDCAGGYSGADFAGKISACASIVSNKTVESREYSRRYFKPVASYSVDVYFSKSLYTPPEPVVPPTPKPFVPMLILCGGGRIFICPHGAHDLSNDLVSIVEQMDCECVADDSRKFACIKMLSDMRSG